MDNKETGSVLVGYLVIAAIIIGISSVFITKREDNPIEETSESIVEHVLNLPQGTIDLTPSSHE